MRVTFSIQNRQYLRNTNNSLKNMLKSYDKIMTQKKFNRVSQDPSNASKSVTTRRQLWNLDMYNSNLATAKEVFSAAETNLRSINNMYVSTVKPKIIQGANISTYDPTDRQIIATEMRLLADHIVDTMNADFAERKLFGGTSAGATPYVLHDSVSISINQSVLTDGLDPADAADLIDELTERFGAPDAGGNFEVFNLGGANRSPVVCYNGVPVDMSALDERFAGLPSASYSISYVKDGVAVDRNGRADSNPQEIYIDFDRAREARDNSLLFPASNPIFVDVGMGINYINGEVDPQTAMDISLNGAKMLGSGLYGGFSHNMAQALYDAAFALDNDDRFDIVAAIDALDNSMTNVLQSITNIGAKHMSIDFYEIKNEDYEFSLKERQNNVEGVDIYDEITYFNALEAAFQAALQLSAKVLPRSVFDFI